AAPVALNAANGSTYVWSPVQGLSSSTGATVNASPAVNTIYTVTGTDANGCSNVATANITAGSKPFFFIEPSSVNICNGGSVNLNILSTFSGTYTYTTTVTIPAAGTTSGTSDPYPASVTVSG